MKKSTHKSEIAPNKILFVLLCVCYFSAVAASPLISQSTVFDPKKDGWYFKNFSTPSDSLTWDLFKRTYLAVNPNGDPIAAPLDILFYEVFKVSSKNGNCGGMSLLALALFKYGGYMGFCAPPKFYKGDPGLVGKAKGPDDNDLYKACNILQARQFSSKGISNIIALGDAGNLNNANMAFKQVKEALARGDYPLLCIAKDYEGDAAHTVIAYKVDEASSGTYRKTIYVWDSNHPYNNDTTFYDVWNPKNIVRINTATDWKYEPTTSNRYVSSVADGGWCFCQPMSYVLDKSRHPFNLDVAQKEVKSLIVTGAATSVSQITDNQGRSFYKTEANEHIKMNEVESDPNKKLEGIIRWPWFDQRRVQTGAAAEEKKPELYFMRGSTAQNDGLNVTISGQKYEAVFVAARNMIRINCDASSRAKDVISFANVATTAQSLAIKTTGAQRNIRINQLRTDDTGKEWRSIDVKDLKVTPDVPVLINVLGDFSEVVVSSQDKVVDFYMDIQQRREGIVTTRNVGKLSTKAGSLLRIAPRNWEKLEKTEIKSDMYPQIKLKK